VAGVMPLPLRNGLRNIDPVKSTYDMLRIPPVEVLSARPSATACNPQEVNSNV
jgi:hypothetical protein